jgi:hypothetical protein
MAASFAISGKTSAGAHLFHPADVASDGAGPINAD